MKALLTIALVLLPVFLPAAAGQERAGDHSTRCATIIDSKGTAVAVKGLHYCYEEELEDGLFVSKFDEIFVRAGEAVINVRLDSIAEVEFTGKVAKRDGVRDLEARIVMRDGGAATVPVICHRAGCLEGRVALGEYELPLDRVKKMVFQPAAERKAPAIRVVVAEEKEAAGKGVLTIVVPAKGEPKVVGGSGSVGGSGTVDGKGTVLLKDSDRPLPERVVLKAEGSLSYAVLREVFRQLTDRGVREVHLLP